MGEQAEECDGGQGEGYLAGVGEQHIATLDVAMHFANGVKVGEALKWGHNGQRTQLKSELICAKQCTQG
jgi:hypothetical protein